MAKKKHFATRTLRCGIKDKAGKSITFMPGEEIPCDDKLGESLVEMGAATQDPQIAKGVKAEHDTRLNEVEEFASAENEIEEEDDTDEPDDEDENPDKSEGKKSGKKASKNKKSGKKK